MNLGEIRQFFRHFVCDIDAARPCGYNLLKIRGRETGCLKSGFFFVGVGFASGKGV
jgi:hypothetical protein